MRFKKLLKLPGLFGITLLLVSLLFSSCATTSDLNLLRDDLNKTKKEVQEVQEKTNKLENFAVQTIRNFMKFMEIYNGHIREFHQDKKYF
jgi:hypothetical protein